MNRPNDRPGRLPPGGVRLLASRIEGWHRASVRRRLLVAMLAVSVIPLALFSLAGLAALSGINSGALKTANTRLERSQDGHLLDLVASKAQVINTELESVQDEISLLSQSTAQRLADPPSTAQSSGGATTTGAGLDGNPGPQLYALESLGGSLGTIYRQHPEVADVWVELPGSGLVEVAPSSAIPSTNTPGLQQPSPPTTDYQAGVLRLAQARGNPHWRTLLGPPTRSLVWTPVYDNPVTGGPTVTVASETSVDGTAFWVGANITVKNLVSDFLVGPPGRAEGGYAFLLSSNGNLLSYSPSGQTALTGTKRGAPTTDLLSTESPWQPVGSQMTVGLSGQQTVTVGGERLRVFFSPLPASQWSLGVAVPVAGIDSSVVGFSQTISHGLLGATWILLPVLVLLAGLAVLLTNLLSHRMLHPLTILTAASRRIAGGDLSTPLAVAAPPHDEIGTLEGALEGMRLRLSQQRQQIDAARRHLEQRVDERTSELRQRNSELATLNSVSAGLSRSLVLADVAATAAEELRQLWPLAEVSVYLSDATTPNGVRLVGRSGEAPKSGTLERLPEALELAGRGPAAPVQLGDLVVEPLQVTGSEVGYLVLRQRGRLGRRQLETLEVVGGQLALALRNAQLFADTQEMATINERNRIAREIHDTLAQGLAGILVQLQAADAWMALDPGRAQSAIGQAVELARSSLREARRSVWDLRPEGLERAGLAGAIREELSRLQEHGGIRTSLRQRGIKGRGLPATLEVAVFRVVREALSNAVRHGAPSQVAVELSRSRNLLRVVVSDDGCGFDPQGPLRPGGFGITSMRERAASCGGTLQLVAGSECGTQVVLEVPCPDPAPEGVPA